MTAQHCNADLHPRVRPASLSWIISVLLAVGFGTGTAYANEPFAVGAVMRVAAAELERSHFSKKKLDDKLSRDWLDAFATSLDPRRMYFLESDLREFRRYQDQLDDLARAGDFEFPLLVRKRLRHRIGKAVTYAFTFMAAEHNYSVDEECPLRYEDYASTEDALEERWRLHTKLEFLIEKVHGRERKSVQAQLAGRYQRIAKRIREMTDEKLCEIYINALASVYDPHSGYLGPTTLRSYTHIAPVKTFRLGLVLWRRHGRYSIIAIDSSLGAKASQPDLVGWELLGIRRTEGETIDLVDMTYDELYHLINWPMGPLQSDTEVILELIHPVTLHRETQSWVRF